jgi:hypothetical protein
MTTDWLGLSVAVAEEPMSADLRLILADALEGGGQEKAGARQRSIAAAIARGRHDAPDGAHFNAIRKAFGYRKRRLMLVLAERVELHGDYWDGGSKTTYHTYDLRGGGRRTLPGANPFTAGRERRYEPTSGGVVVVTTEVFCGKPGTMTVHVHPDDYPLLTEEGE